jgi:hypothetical protein
MNVNKVACIEPLPDQEIGKIAGSVIKKNKEETLKPIVSLRKIVFNPEVGYSAEEKRDIVLQLCNEKRSGEVKQKLYEIIENWDWQMGKISQRKIIANNSIAKKTVEKYWFEFKEHVKELNNRYSSQ